MLKTFACILLSAVLTCGSAWMQITRAESFATADLASASLSMNCLDWRITGVCFWLRCSIFGCRVVTSLRIGHRLPDLVVQTYHDTGNPPWAEWSPLLNAGSGVLGSAIGGGGGGTVTSQSSSDALNFYEADVVGNPVAELAGKIPGHFLCKTDVDAFRPYYVSVVDLLAWRSGLAEPDQILNLDVREVGENRWNTWGPLDPRNGFVTQQDAAKGAAVCAARAVDIVTVDSSGHIAHEYQGGEGSQRNITRGDHNAPNEAACRKSGGTWETPKGEGECRPSAWFQWRQPTAVAEDNWQLIVPESSPECRAFGASEPPSKVAVDGEYAWQWWQEYRCCRKRGIYLGRIGD